MSTTLERLEFLRAVDYEARWAVITYLVSGVDDDEWDGACGYAINAARRERFERARQAAQLEASQHVSDGRQERGAGEVEPVEGHVDVP